MKISNDDLFYKIGEQSDDGYFVFNINERRFVYHNHGLSNILQLSKQEINCDVEKLIEFVHPEDRLHAINCFTECKNQLSEKKYEIRLQLNGREKFLRFSLYPFINEQTKFISGIVEDTTIDRHNKIHIEQINARKNIMLEVLSHDLKEPLGMIRLEASAIEDELAYTGNTQMMSSVSFIKEMCERNIKLVRSLINKEFLKSSLIELKKDRVELVWELEDLIRFYKRSHLRDIKDFRFTASYDKIYLMLDTMKFMQVINNLISNAIKFTPVNGMIDLSVIDKENTVLVTVADNGLGIADELKPNLFERNSQNLKLGLQGENSGGLGMNIIKTIVELHNGEIWFESEKGKGSKFHIELPKN